MRPSVSSSIGIAVFFTAKHYFGSACESMALSKPREFAYVAAPL